MKKRLIVYFNYHPNGQADAACRFAVQQMAAVGNVLFVNNGVLEPDSRQWAQSCCQTVLERENTGFDVGAYRDAILHVGGQALKQYDEVVLMNYTLAGPVCNVSDMFDAMEQRPELDFWGLTRHYAMRSRRFGGAKAIVPEHIQSHFVVVRSRMMADFFAYWQSVELPKTYEESVRLHETRFTAHFAAMGYRWDTYVNTADLENLFVNPIMACPRELLANRCCPFFKRRSFFTPYADELRRTDGQAAAELYDYLTNSTAYPIDALLRSLLPVHPLAAIAQNLHWHYILPQSPAGKAPVLLDADALAIGCKLEPDVVYSIPLHEQATGVAAYYYTAAKPDARQQMQAAALLEQHPLIGVLGPAIPLYAGCAEQKVQRWQAERPAVQAKLNAMKIQIPLDETPPPLPNGGCLLVLGAAFPQGLPPLQEPEDDWLLPLIAQANGYGAATFETAAQCAARTDVLNSALAAQHGVGATFRLLGRAVKKAVRKKRKEHLK